MYKNLVAELARKGIGMQQFAEELGINRNTLRNKINGVSDFSWKEVYRIHTKNFPECEIKYLFAFTCDDESQHKDTA